MSRERILEVVLTMLGAVLLFIAAAGKHPYGFYMVLRLVITIGAVYWAWRVYKAGPRAWTWIFVAVALLLNPFLPIRMQRAQWQPIDLCLGILLIGWSGYWLFRDTQDQGGSERSASPRWTRQKLCHQGSQREGHAMRVRDIFTIESMNTMADTLARLPDVLSGSLVFLVVPLCAAAALHLMETRRVFEGLLLAGMIIPLWLCILALGKQVESAERKLVDAHNMLFRIASQECRCDPNAIIIEAPEELELVGEPMGECQACQARAFLKEQCPTAVEPPVIFLRTGTREEFEAHQAKLEEENPFEEELSQDEPKPGDPEYEMLKAKLLRLQAELGVSDTPKP